MADMLNDLYAAIRTRIAAVWPDVATAANGIWETDHVSKIPYETLQAPYAVIVISDFPVSGDWGCGNSAFAPNVDIYRVVEVKGPLIALRTDLNNLRHDLLVNELTNGQVLDVTAIDTGKSLAPNEIFASKRMTHWSGKITAECLIGEVLV